MLAAVLSDNHDVMPALEVVARAADPCGAGLVVLTCDLASGPVETLDALRVLGGRVVWVHGNADRELVQCRRGEPCSVPDSVTPWAESGFDRAGEWADYFLRSVVGDADALQVFGPRDGR